MPPKIQPSRGASVPPPPSPTLPYGEGGEELRALGGAMVAEAVLLQIGKRQGVAPGALRVLAMIAGATVNGVRAITTGVLYDLAVCNPVTIRKQLPGLTASGYLRRTRATKKDAPLIYLTGRGADVVKRYILAQQRAERALLRKLADIA